MSAPVDVEGFGSVSPDQLRAFDDVRPDIEAAVSRGYRSYEYCQGGAVVFTRAMIVRMAAAGYLRNGERWLPLPLWSDQTMAMYAHAVGLRVCDCSRPGDPFGVQYIGLPYVPQELVRRGYSLIHSVKNDPRYRESEIRAFFRDRARALTPSSQQPVDR